MGQEGKGRDGMDIPGRKNRVYKGVEVGIERVGPGSGNPRLLAQRVHSRKQNVSSSQRKVDQDFKGLQAEVMDQCSGVRVSEKNQV